MLYLTSVLKLRLGQEEPSLHIATIALLKRLCGYVITWLQLYGGTDSCAFKETLVWRVWMQSYIEI
jgi:hypothetical protein